MNLYIIMRTPCTSEEPCSSHTAPRSSFPGTSHQLQPPYCRPAISLMMAMAWEPGKRPSDPRAADSSS